MEKIPSATHTLVLEFVTGAEVLQIHSNIIPCISWHRFSLPQPALYIHSLHYMHCYQHLKVVQNLQEKQRETTTVILLLLKLLLKYRHCRKHLHLLHTYLAISTNKITCSANLLQEKCLSSESFHWYS